MENNTTIIRTIPFSEFDLWDVKRFVKSPITSKYQVLKLQNFISERSEKVKLFDFPEIDFGILGVNNKEGVFDAYIEKGKNINQSYKKVYNNDLTYNPYRVNVGSIGRKTSEHQNSFISPAYVVFECKNGLDSEFLYRVFKTNTFNKIINDNTTGSVRQNLKFSTLSNIKIPLPPLNEQNRIIKEYNSGINTANKLEKKCKKLEEEIELYLFDILEIKKSKKKEKEILSFVQYSNFDRWDGKTTINLKSKYKIQSVGSILRNISTGTTPSTSRKEYFENGDLNFYTPADLTNQMFLNNSERKVTQTAFDENKARRFNKGTLLFVGIGSTVGKVGIIDNEFATSNQQITGLVFNESKVLIEYAYYYFNYFQEITTREKTQATIPIVNQDKICKIPIPIPPIKIQEDIVKHISRIKSEIQSLKKKSALAQQSAMNQLEQEIFNS
jgi:type I restriction enzyme S subunit